MKKYEMEMYGSRFFYLSRNTVVAPISAPFAISLSRWRPKNV